MADLTPVKTWTTQEKLASTDLNTEFLNGYNNNMTKGTDQTITGTKTVDDDTNFVFGAGTDYWFVYDSVNTQFELNSTNVDGAGADGVVFSVADGTDDVTFTGDIAVTTLAATTLTAGTLTLAAGSITDSSAAITFGDENLSTTGTLGAGATTVTDLTSTGNTTIGNATGDALTFHPSAWTLTNAVSITGTWTDLGTVTTVDINGGTVDGAIVGGASAAAGTFTTLAGTTNVVAASDLTLTSGSIISASGAITFGNENLSTTGTLASGALTVTGATQQNGTLTVGVDDTGYDVKFFGATASAYFLWDESADSILTSDGTNTLTIKAASITDSSGAISFGNENLSTTGTLAAGATTVTGAVLPNANDGGALGASGTGWSDLFLASGGVINWNAGDVTLTHAANKLTADGGDLHIANGNGLVVGHTAQVAFGSGTPEFQVLGTSTGDAHVAVANFVGNDTPGAIELAKSGSGTVGSFSAITTGWTLGNISWAGDDGTDIKTVGARISAVSEGTIGSNRIPASLRFYTGTDAAPTVLTEALRIDSSQNVGIGVTPQGTEATYTSISHGGNAFSIATTTPAAGSIWVQAQNAHYDTDASWEYISTDEASYYFQGNGTHIWYNAASGTAGTDITWSERMRIDSSGNVGIGVVPGTKFHIAGANAKSGSAETSLFVGSSDVTASNPLGVAFGHGGSTGTGNIQATELGLGIAGLNLQPSGGAVYINETTNANMTVGLTINQGANDNEILAFKAADITGGGHGVTTIAETDTYAYFQESNATNIGVEFGGFATSANGIAMLLWGTTATQDTTKSTAAVGNVEIRASAANGTSRQTMGAATANSNLMVIRDDTTSRFIFDEDGDGHADVSWTTFSDRRLKSNIETIPYGLKEINALDALVFDKQSGAYEDGELVLEDNKRRMLGFIAQDAKALMPELVKDVDETTSFYSLDYGRFTPVLWKGMQELTTKVSENAGAVMTSHLKLQQQINALEDEIAALKAA